MKVTKVILSPFKKHISNHSNLDFVTNGCILYTVYTEQILSGPRSGLRSKRCTRLHWTFIVQYNKVHHIVVHRLAIVTLQNT